MRKENTSHLHNSNMNWELIVDALARKQLKRIPQHDAERLLSAIDELAVNPFAGDIEKMEGEKKIWRRRIGNYRIFYEIVSRDKTIYVFRVERRTSSTY